MGSEALIMIPFYFIIFVYNIFIISLTIFYYFEVYFLLAERLFSNEQKLTYVFIYKSELIFLNIYKAIYVIDVIHISNRPGCF